MSEVYDPISKTWLKLSQIVHTVRREDMNDLKRQVWSFKPCNSLQKKYSQDIKLTTVFLIIIAGFWWNWMKSLLSDT